MSNIFETASKIKLRISTGRGLLSVEDLWDLSLESLDTIAISVNKELKANQEESFIGKKTKANDILELKLEILKHIITVKLAEKQAKAQRAERNAKLAQLRELAISKQNEALAGSSLEEINNMIAELEKEE